ncbi:hypothetical protein PR048_015965 [Dryococelus australis]|uniref:Reverse transcriptase domain-containing protein n=1 Tax=Dryococelus australis TaxID=614101 RepID=A0ABQ9HJJ4_9NEOP|nr:hypothetical protein PR048_015965 [Dryococelus australis]
MKKSGIQTTKDQDKYKFLCLEIQRNCRKDKSQFIHNICEETAQHLYSDGDRTELQGQTEETDKEPYILRCEVENANKHLSNINAPGIDGISSEILKVMGNEGASYILISLHKKGSVINCSNYRIIALISHPSKILSYVLNQRLKAYIRSHIATERAGFVEIKGTLEQILDTRQIIEKAREFCAVKIDGDKSDFFSISKGVRQGCILPPQVYNIYGEYIISKALDGLNGGVSVGGRKISNLRFVNDTSLLASSEDELTDLLDGVINFQLTGRLKSLEVAKHFVYLGSNICNTGSCEEEMRRIILGKVAAADYNRIDALEMWFWRKMLRVSWTEKRTNASITAQLNVSKLISSHVNEMILQFFRHIVRRKYDNLEKTILEGKIEGKNPRGKAPIWLLDQVSKITGLPFQRTIRQVGNRSGWLSLIKKSTRNQD